MPVLTQQASALAIKRRWLRRLRRLHERLLHIEAVAECMGDFVEKAQDWSSAGLGNVFIPMWFHWSAIGLRSVCSKGPARHQHANASIEGFLEELSGNAEVFLKVARIEEVRGWLGRSPDRDVLRNRINKDKAVVLRTMRATKRYGDIVAHVLLRDRKIKGKRLRLCRENARQILDQYQRLLTRRPLPDGAKRTLVDRFRSDLDRLRKV